MKSTAIRLYELNGSPPLTRDTRYRNLAHDCTFEASCCDDHSYPAKPNLMGSELTPTSTTNPDSIWPSLRPAPSVAIIGASGGIGSALARYIDLAVKPGMLHTFSRNNGPGIEDEATVAEFARQASEQGPLDLVFVATGILHEGDGLRPEKRLQDWNAASLSRAYAVNAIGPALVAKHFLPLLRRDVKTVFAALSARVGSITDNRLGGWASYRASKAALNMLLKTAAIEHRRSHPLSVVAAIHPGTVDTALSSPYQSNVPSGQLTTPADAARNIAAVIDQLTVADTGGFFAWDGSAIGF